MRAFIFVFVLLVGCNTPNALIRQIKRKETRLIAKGVTIPKDTLKTVKTDTLINEFFRNDTLFSERLIYQEVETSPIIEYRTRWQTKYETKYKYKTIKVEAKQETKQAKQQLKEVKIVNRVALWKKLIFVLLFISVFGILVYYKIQSNRKAIKCKQCP